VGEISFIESRPAPAGRYCFPSLQASSGATSATSSIRRGLVRGSRTSTAQGAAPRKPRSGGDQLHRVAACSRWAVLLSVAPSEFRCDVCDELYPTRPRSRIQDQYRPRRGTPKTSQWGRSASSSRGLLPLGGTAFRRSKRDPVRPLRRALSDEASFEDPGPVPPKARHPENLAVGEISASSSRGLLPLGGTAFRRSKRDPVRPLRRALSDEASFEDPGPVPPKARHPENLAVGEISASSSRGLLPLGGTA